MRKSVLVISMGKKNLSLVTSRHAHELFFEKVSKLVKISLGASLLFLEKNRKTESKRQAL